MWYNIAISKDTRVYIAFSTPEPPKPISLCERLSLEGQVRFSKMASGISLTYEDNDPEIIEVWVAQKPRTAIVEHEQPTSRYIPVLGVSHA